MAMLINTNTPNLLNGVSQQADDLRRTSQGVEQINALSSLIEGLKKRPPTEHQKVVTGDAIPTAADLSDFFGFVVNRDDDEKHYIRINTTLSVSAMSIDNLVDSSASVTVKNASDVAISASDLTYLHTDNAQRDLRSLTIDDYTFVVNRAITPAMTADKTSLSNPSALVFVKQTRENAEYTVKLWKDETSTGTPDYDVTYTATAADDQGDVINGLLSALTTASANSFFSYLGEGGTMYVEETDGSDFRIEVPCSLGDALFAFKEEVQALELLPEEAYAGFKIKIIGDADTADDEYYVQYKSSNSNISTGFTTGYWEETIADDITYKIDKDTMPHVLISNADGSFTFKPTDWGERVVGDESSVPAPSFVSDSIRGMFFYKNRLGILTGESAVFSEVGQYFNYFRNTIVQLLDSDPIDIKLASSDISLLNYGINTAEKLVLFSDRIQFTIESSNDVLSAATIESKEVTNFTNYVDAKPIEVGNTIFFGYDKGAYSGIKEYFIGDDTSLFNGQDVTDSCPRYLEGDVLKMVSIDSESFIAVKTDGYETGLYIYTYYNQGNKRVQASWSKFDFGEDAIIYDIFAVGTKLYALVCRDSECTLELFDVASGLKDANSDMVVTLDRRIDETDLVSISYSAITNVTTITAPYDFSTNADVAIVTRPTSSSTGNVRLNNVSLSSGDSAVLTVKGDYSSETLFVGQSYEMRYTMTRPTIREQKGETSIPVYTGRSQVRYGTISLDNSRLLEIEVTPLYRSKYTYLFTSRNLGTGSTLVGATLEEKDQQYRFPVLAQNTKFNIDLVNDSPFPSNILGINWEIMYHTRSRRI